MPINNYLASSSIAKPGVCTSTTRPAVPYNGQVIYETDTARTLVYNGSGWVFLSTSAAGDVGLVKIIPSSATYGTVGATGDVTVGSAVASVTVSGVFSASFDHYRIIYMGGSAGTANDIGMRLGAANTGYYERMIYADYGTGAVTGQALSGGGAQWNYVGCQDTPNSVTVDLFNPYNTVKTTMSGPYIGTGTGRVGGTIAGFLNDTTSYTAFTLLTNAGAATGSITGGTIRVYGYRN